MNDPYRRRGIALLALAAVITLAAVVVLARSGDGAPPVRVGIVAPESTGANDEVERIQEDPAFIPETASPPESEIPDAPSDLPRGTAPPRRSTDPVMGGGEDGMIQDVAWPDRRAAARQALVVAPILASLYGRDLEATVATLRPRMTTRALRKVEGELREDPPPAGTKPPRATVSAANLRNDPETGERTSIVSIEYPRSGDTATVYLTFSPSDTRIADWQYEMD